MSRSRRLTQVFAFVLIVLAMRPAECYAGPKAANPVTIQDRVVNLGVGRWVCVDERNGLTLIGRITGIGDQSFGMQLHNYPEITDVRYADVVRVRGVGLTGKGMFALIGVSAGAAVAVALIMHHEFEANKATLPQPISSASRP